MRLLDHDDFKEYLIKTEWAKAQLGVYNDRNNAVMVIPYPNQNAPATVLRVIAASGGGWDHVSVSLPDRCPTWNEMDFIKRLLFHPHEVCVQYHVAVDDHINLHPYTLHIWRKHGRAKIPLPPKTMV